MFSNLSKVYMIQGPSGPEAAVRPTNEQLSEIREAHWRERSGLAWMLSRGGKLTLDKAVDVWGWDYWKTMDRRRVYGYTWLPAAHQPSVPVAPGLVMLSTPSFNPNSPPLGAILVPPSEEEDPNFIPPEPPPEASVLDGIVTDFGALIESGYHAGAYRIGPLDTSPLNHIAKGPDGERYMKVFEGGWKWVAVVPVS